MNYLIETKKLSKSIKGELILKDIDLHVPEGEIYCLVGNNGAGKSTLLKIICGMLAPTSGEMYFNNHLWSRRDLEFIGSLIENPSIYGNLTATENLQIVCTLKNIDFTEISNILELVGLEKTKNKKSSNFSLGMKERLGIAMALIGNPKLLILDEPTNGLDPEGIKELRNLILNLKQKGMTIIVSTHMLTEVNYLADYMGILSDGNLISEGKYNKDVLEKLFE